MINSKMRMYSYYKLNDEPDEYGQLTLNTNPQGTIKMNINIVSQSVVDNIKYNQASYIGLTSDRNINDKYVIQYNEDEKLKVLYVNPKGKLLQVFLGDYQ